MKCNCVELIKSIDRYIAKVDDDLQEQMEDAGYVDAEESVSNASDLEDEIAEVLQNQTEEIIEELKSAGDWKAAKKVISAYFANDSYTRDTLEAIFQEYYEVVIPSLANSYIQQTAGDMVVNDIRMRTSSWMDEWSGELADIMQLTSEEQMGSIVQSAIDNGQSVSDLTRRLMEEGIRNEEWRARRASITEMLRSHSVAQQEAMTQSPVVDRKKWRHSGSYKSVPRPNHVAMDGKIVPKNEPFELIGKDGVTYYPMYPRDSSLPPGESVNCGCIAQPVVDDDVLGMSLEERQKLQQEIIDADDGEWEKELDARNREKAGITAYTENEDFNNFDRQKATINRKQIASADYRKKYDSLGETKKVSRVIASDARTMLRHRSGTPYEDLSFVDSKTGRHMVRDNYNVPKTVKPSRAMMKMIKESDDYTIIGIHNHPESYSPSFSDIKAAYERKYKYGIVVCHNGNVYKYRIVGELNRPIAEGALDLWDKTEYSDDIANMLLDAGIEMEVL